MATIPELFAIATAHHQAGRLADAEPLYRQILQLDPNHADTLHLLGVLAHQVGKHDAAIELINLSIQKCGTAANVHNNLGGVYRAVERIPQAIASFRRALEIRPDYAEAHINLGNALEDQNRLNRDIDHSVREGEAPAEPSTHQDLLNEAIDHYRRAVELKPGLATAQIALANALKELQRLNDAVVCYERALELQPQDFETWINLGNTLKDQGKIDRAVDCYRQALNLHPDLAIAHLNLGAAIKEQGQIAEAIDCYRRALELNPNLAEAHNNLGVALHEKQDFDGAIACYGKAIELKADYSDAYNNLGNSLVSRGKLTEAVDCYLHAIKLQPNSAKAHSNLGAAYKGQGKLEQAIACYRRAVELQPDYAEAHNNMGAALKAAGKLDEATASCQQAIALRPDYADAYNHLGNIYKDRGQLDDAIKSYQHAVNLNTGDASTHSNLIYTCLFHPAYDRDSLFRMHREWNQQHAAPLARSISPHANDRTPERRLRIGYISPDFRNHVVGRNLLPLFREHYHNRFEIFCYSDVPCPDDLTKRFQSYADVFRNSTGSTDAQLAQRIREDHIDILVDLTLHMALNRLLVFGRKPAPIQITFAGYPGTTGLTTIDYRLTDAFLDPLTIPDDCYSEESIRLASSFWCYDPLDGNQSVNTLPAISNQYVTFGCLNNFCKVNTQCLKMWAAVLKTVEGSRMIILAGEGAHRERTHQFLFEEGIDKSRVTFVSNQPRQQYLKIYNQIDVGLDTVPYNGHSTSLDSYWMGVPVVTLVGRTVTGRAGFSQLMNLGMPELISNTSDEFVGIATELANDLPRLVQIRETLRGRMQRSLLMNAPRFARSIEDAYRNAWHRWCDGNRNEDS